MTLARIGVAIVGLVALGAVAPAAAAPQVEILWTATTGSGATGGASIQAVNGDQLTATVYVSADANGINVYAVSVEFDTACPGIGARADDRERRRTLPDTSVTLPDVVFSENR